MLLVINIKANNSKFAVSIGDFIGITDPHKSIFAKAVNVHFTKIGFNAQGYDSTNGHFLPPSNHIKEIPYGILRSVQIVVDDINIGCTHPQENGKHCHPKNDFCGFQYFFHDFLLPFLFNFLPFRVGMRSENPTAIGLAF